VSTSIKYLRMALHLPDGEKRPIGYLSCYGDILRASFEQSYVRDPLRPTLSLGYIGANESETEQILTSARDRRLVRADGKWPSYFQNLLPEGHNRERLADQRGCSADDEFELLAAAGHDLMGALEVGPVPDDEDIPQVVKHWHVAMGLDVLEPGFVGSPVENGASLPGVITKFSAVKEGRRYVVKRHGAAGSSILKLPSTRHPDLVHNEYSGYALMRALGLECANAVIVPRDETDLPEQIPFPEILAVERFDRGPNGRRIHIEEFAQVLNYDPKHKYGKALPTDFVSMLSLLERLSGRPAVDVAEFVRRFVAFILMGNTDAHMKNWALRYPDGRTPELAPLYDPVCVTAFFADAPTQDYGINRSIDARLREFTWDDLAAMLHAARLLRPSRLMQLARKTVQQARSEWPILLADAPPTMRDAITERLAGGVALAR
jgi:serine/threonine-protein kinase HipA